MKVARFILLALCLVIILGIPTGASAENTEVRMDVPGLVLIVPGSVRIPYGQPGEDFEIKWSSNTAADIFVLYDGEMRSAVTDQPTMLYDIKGSGGAVIPSSGKIVDNMDSNDQPDGMRTENVRVELRGPVSSQAGKHSSTVSFTIAQHQ